MFSFVRRGPFLLWGVVFVCIGTAMYLCGILMVIPRYLLGMNAILLPLNEWIVWYSGMPMTLGFTLILIDLLLFFPHKRSNGVVRDDTIADRRVTVTLTAYNDELSIGDAVADFLAHPMVRRVIVVSNNSTDSTLERAREAGAMVFNETSQGYGRCVFRCLKEAVDLNEAELIILCEGDRTFRASDIEKFLAYAPHADIVNGTRTVERLRV